MSLLLALAALGCSKTPGDAFKDMQQASCKGDIQGVFQYVDRTKVKENMVTQVTEEMRAKSGSLGAAMLSMAADKATADAFQQWEDDIKRGEDSSFCQSSDVKNEKGSRIVTWETPSAKSKRAVFEPAGDTWIMVKLENADDAQRR